MKKRPLFLRGVSGALIVIVIVAILALGIHINRVIRGSYAVWWVANMCVEHMAANNGAWPKSWDDLRDDYQKCVASSGQPLSFEELSGQVAVDWEADPRDFAARTGERDARELRVIWLRNGKDWYWKGHEPNQIVLDYIGALNRTEK